MSDESLFIKNDIELLRKRILEADKAYYVDSSPIISDQEYDGLFDKLIKLEEKYPEYNNENSPTKRVGSDIDNTLPEKEHTIPTLSLDKCYNIDDLISWIDKNKIKLGGHIELVIEPKIDGASIVLYYQNGKLISCLTRGNGFVGNDITENIKTIGSVPLVIDDKDALAVRGEVFINKNDFEIFNEKFAEGKYSNPRNLASGAVRRQKSKEVAKFPLNIIVYEGFYDSKKIDNHKDILIDLKNLGFPLNDHLGFFSEKLDSNLIFPFKDAVVGKISDISNYIDDLGRIRNTLPYEIDGLVIKINDLKSREALGFTQHHPRWAIAYKFDAPLAVTRVKSIIVQIGRGGRATPVAILEPVELSGSIISRATLHNQDYIDALQVNEGDTVTISKRGDVIPAVEEVIEKGINVSSFKMNKICPGCGEKLFDEGAHLFCKNEECNLRLLETLKYFVSRGQMDIESLGGKTIEFLFQKGFIKEIPDIYFFDYNRLFEFEGFKDKKINNIIQAINESKKKDFKTILSSLGLKDIGNKVAQLLTDNFGDIDTIIDFSKNKDISKFTSIDGIGESIANSIIDHFNNSKVLDIINRLKKSGLNFIENKENKVMIKNQFLNNTRWVITGSFENFKPREKAGELIEKYGGEVLTSVSSKITHLLCGESAGSKLDKARSLNIAIIDETEFINMFSVNNINIIG